jgi:hypothetical protein
MSQTKKYTLSILILLLAAFMPVLAFEKVGTTSFQFLKVSTNARAAGMGEAFTAVADNSEGLFYNPAAIVYVKNLDFSAGYLDWFLDIYHSAVTAAYTVPGIGSFGIQGLLTDAGEIKVTSVDALGFVGDKYLGYTGEVINPGAMMFGISYARSLTEKFSFGVTVKYAREDLGVRTAGDIAFDGGLLYKTGFRSLKLSAVIRNFGPEVKFYDEVDIPRYDPVNDVTYYQKYSGKGYPMPQTFNIGVSAFLIGTSESMLFDSGTQTLQIAFDLVQPRDFDQQYNIGLEYGFRNILFLRGGYKLNYDSETFSLGFGLAYDQYRIDYAYTDYGDFLDPVHRFSFGFSID